MEDQRKMELQNQFERVRETAFRLRDEQLSRDPRMTAREQEFAEPRDIECILAHLKSTMLGLGGNMKEDEARLSESRATLEEKGSKFAQILQIYKELEDYVGMKKAQSERAVQRRSTYPMIIQALTWY